MAALTHLRRIFWPPPGHCPFEKTPEKVTGKRQADLSLSSVSESLKGIHVLYVEDDPLYHLSPKK